MNDALVALDMQVDLLDADGRLSVAQAQVDGLITATNAALTAAAERGLQVAYVNNACPTIPPMRGPDDPPLPVMLLRLTGGGERGAFSSEAYVEICERIVR